MWTDRFTDPLPANIKSVCEWREKLCHPVWTWNVPKEGAYNCKYENNTAIILDTTVLNHQNVPVGVPGTIFIIIHNSVFIYFPFLKN